MPADPKRLQSIFLAAVEADDRAAVLDRECDGDPDLRRHVEKLLAAHEDSAELPAAVAATGDYASAAIEKLAPGSVFAGRYKLREQLGEGGMGVVYVADQTEPVQRRVALKIIRANLPTETLLARFEQERQALALMDHPNIAKVYDAGVAENTPYFVMELINGLPITKYCDDAKLTPKQRLELFIPVCQAVQHAHQKGIIHRDLKPANIIVGLYDGKPVPKVIDFGVAKMTGPRITEHSVYTEVGSIIGTLEYMSPEQAELNNLDIDTRTDIYALGVILYELLTGTVPFSRKEMQSAGFGEMLRIIKEQEPSKPSTKLSGSGSLPSVAACRHTEPAKLTRLVRGELDWITMKTLEKDRTCRYGTANGLAMDIQRYLDDEPVLASPPSAAYRMKKFVRRNKGQVIAASMILLALVAGIAGTSWGFYRESQRAEAERQARQEADKQTQLAVAEKLKAEKAEEETLASYRASTDDAIEKLIGSKSFLGSQEKAYLQNTLKRWQAFADRMGNDERSQAFRAEGHFRLGSLWELLGRREEARREYEVARDDYKKLSDAYPAEPSYKKNMAGTHGNLGKVLAELGRREEAQRESKTARDLQKKLADTFPDVPEYRAALATSHNNLGYLLAGLGFPDEARREYELARDLQKKLADTFPGVPEYLQNLAFTHNNLGFLLHGLRRDLEARREYETALDLRKKLANALPPVPVYQLQLADTHNNLGLLVAGMGLQEEAQREYESARDLQKKLVDEFPAVPEYQVHLSATYCNLGKLDSDYGRPEESLRWYELAIRTLTPVHKAEPRDVQARGFLRNCHWNRAMAYDRLKRLTEAVNDWNRAIELSSISEQPHLRASRATTRLQAGQVAEAIAELAELIPAGTWTAGQLYDFACVYAVASGKLAEKKQEHADKAMELLQKAVKAGYKDAAHMKKDTDLDALRDREDFKKLIAELEKVKK